MKILFITSSFLPRIGGVEKHVYEISRHLAEQGHDVQVVTEDILGRNINKNSNYQSYGLGDNEARKSKEIDKSVYLSYKNWGGINVYYFWFGRQDWFKKFRIWLMLFKHRTLIRDADVVHCHDVFFWYLPFRFLYFKKPIYTTFHGYETKFPPSYKAIVIRKICEILSWGNICIGEFIKKWYHTKSNIVAYGAPTVKWLDYRVKENRKNRKKKIKILFVGRLDEDTGIPIYLNALEHLKAEGVDFMFSACGDGILREFVEKWGKVYGFVGDISPHLYRTDFVFASSYLSILDGMVSKKPVFSAYNNKLKEDYLKMSPFSPVIIMKDNGKGLAEEIMYYAKHPKEREELIDKGYRLAKNYSWNKLTLQYLKLWEAQ